ncbi:hypothetical protein ABK040_003543 [Willaertia magna]
MQRFENKRIIVVSCEKELQNTKDRHAIVTKRLLEKYNVKLEVMDWLNITKDILLKTIEKEQEIIVVIRTPWDYVKYYSKFVDWLQELITLQKEYKNIKVYNDPSLMLWNSSKTYFFDIDKWNTGISCVPTELINKQVLEMELNNDILLDKLFTKFNTNKLVIKPAVSAGSFRTYVIAKDNDSNDSNDSNHNSESNDSNDNNDYLVKGNKIFNYLRKWSLEEDKDYLVQPFCEEIVNDGEYSFIYIAEKFHHVIKKSPKRGDFRVQPEFESTIKGIPKETFDNRFYIKIEQLIKKVKEEKSQNHLILYCRVDVLIKDYNNCEMLLGEMELIEPHLYFELMEGEEEVEDVLCVNGSNTSKKKTSLKKVEHDSEELLYYSALLQ